MRGRVPTVLNKSLKAKKGIAGEGITDRRRNMHELPTLRYYDMRTGIEKGRLVNYGVGNFECR
jgi:hypothetical protein